MCAFIPLHLSIVTKICADMNHKVKLKRNICLDESYKFEEAEKSDLLAKKLEERYAKKYALKHLYSMHNQKIMQFADGCKQMLEIGCGIDRKSTRLNSSHIPLSRMPSSA